MNHEILGQTQASLELGQDFGTHASGGSGGVAQVSGQFAGGTRIGAEGAGVATRGSGVRGDVTHSSIVSHGDMQGDSTFGAAHANKQTIAEHGGGARDGSESSDTRSSGAGGSITQAGATRGGVSQADAIRSGATHAGSTQSVAEGGSGAFAMHEHFELTPLEQSQLQQRNHLISALLQERRVPRLIVAPKGFGKSSLAREYASRLFDGKRVVWIDASLPDFLEALDADSLLKFNAANAPNLIIIDDVPYLSQERADTFAKSAERLAYNGSELLVCSTPSRDCLSMRLRDFQLLEAADLLVGEGECLGLASQGNPRQRARALQAWKRANSRLMGRVPAVYWGRNDEACANCLQSFFAELHDYTLAACATALFFLGEGKLDALHATGLELSSATEHALVFLYPFFGINPTQRTFAVPSFELSMLKEAIGASRYADKLVMGHNALPQQTVRILFDSRQYERAGDILNNFCRPEVCASWLKERGWELLDFAKLELAESLFERCPDTELLSDYKLASTYAWLRGLEGDCRESSYYAQRILRTPDTVCEDSSELACAKMAAYLALLAFGDEGPLIYSKDSYAWDSADASPPSFLAAIVDACTRVELGRAFALGDEARSEELEFERSAPEQQRVDMLRRLATGSSSRFEDSMCYRLALHIMCFVDSPDLRMLVQELGLAVVMHARRNGLHCLSEALSVLDLWNCGFFGPLGHMTDKRDAALLESASRLLKRMTKTMGREELVIPWETGSLAGVAARSRSRSHSAETAPNATDLPVLSVRLFGGFEACVGDRIIPETGWRKKARIMFVLLVLNQGKDLSRDELLLQLWPNIGRTRALNNYYTLWTSMCAAIGADGYLERSGEFCRINPRLVVSDVAEFEQLSRSLLVSRKDTQTLLDTYTRIESLYKGGLLPSEQDYSYINNSRMRYSAMFVDSMVTATAHAIEAHDARLALWFARKAMEVEQEREDVYHALICAQIAAGQRCSAVKTFFRCKEYLREKLGLDPSLKMQELYDQLIATDPSLLKLNEETFKL